MTDQQAFAVDADVAPDRRAPAKQARSRRTRQRLIEAGFELIETKDFDDTGITAFARQANVSIGAFYHHFRDKDDYYAAILETVIADLRQRVDADFAAANLADLDTPSLIRHIVHFIRDVVRDNQGLMRTALKKSMQDPDAWKPVRGFAREYAARVRELLQGRADDFTYRPLDDGLRQGMQMLYSTLFNAVVNRPDPMHIETPLIVNELTRMLIAYLGVRDGAAAADADAFTDGLGDGG